MKITKQKPVTSIKGIIGTLIFGFLIFILIKSVFFNQTNEPKQSIDKKEYIFEIAEFNSSENIGKLLLNTDLPLETEITVSIYRTYWEKNNQTEYSIQYFTETSTIEKWKNQREVVLDNKKWKNSLKQKQKDLSKTNLGFDIDKISDKIKVSAIIPISNKPYPKFKNKKFGETEITYHLPLNQQLKLKSEYGNSLDLKINKVYTISNQTPLMPEFEMSDMSDLTRVLNLKKGTKIKILSIKKKNNTNWYKVKAEMNKSIAIGWINSIALINQELKIK